MNTLKYNNFAILKFLISSAHILLVVRDIDFNFGDHRLIEHRIFELKPSIKFIRMTLTDIHKHARLDDHKRLFM